jgi:hypothetical protein
MTMSLREALARAVDIFGPQSSWDPTQLYGNLTVSPGGNILLGTLTDDLLHKLQVNGTTKLGGNGLVFPDSSLQYSAAPGINRAYNGSCLVNQRAASVTAGTSYTYGGVDRFAAINVGAQGAFTQSQGSFTYQGITRPCVVQSVTTAVASFTTSSLWSGIQQVIPGYDTYDLIGQQISFQFLFYCTTTGTYSACLTDGTTAHSAVQTFTATGGIAKWVTLTFPASASLVIPITNAAGLIMLIGSLGGTGTQAPALNTWNTGNYNTAATNTNWAATVGNYIAATDIQVEAGPVSTPVQRKKFEQHLHECQYFFCKTFPYAIAPAPWTGNAGALFYGPVTGSAYGGMRWTFPRAMRATPGLTFYNCNASATGTAGYWYDQSGQNANSAPGAIGQSELGTAVLLNSATSYSPTNGAWYIQGTASAEY